jgi:hypothetical protein
VDVILPDQGRLEHAAGVKFHKSDLDLLRDLTIIYVERWSEPIPDFMLADMPLVSRSTTLKVRRAFIEAVWETWRDCRRPQPRRKRDKRQHKRAMRYNATNKHCINLLRELFAAAGETPTATMLRRDLHFIKTRRERR